VRLAQKVTAKDGEVPDHREARLVHRWRVVGADAGLERPQVGGDLGADRLRLRLPQVWAVATDPAVHQ